MQLCGLNTERYLAVSAPVFTCSFSTMQLSTTTCDDDSNSSFEITIDSVSFVTQLWRHAIHYVAEVVLEGIARVKTRCSAIGRNAMSSGDLEIAVLSGDLSNAVLSGDVYNAVLSGDWSDAMSTSDLYKAISSGIS